MISRPNRRSTTAKQTTSDSGSRTNGRATTFAFALAAAAVAMATSAGWAIDASAGEHDYVGVKKCKTCHKKEAIGNQYGVWLDAKHSKAFETLATKQAAEWATEAGVDDVHIIAALALHRRMHEFELRHALGDRVYDAFEPRGTLDKLIRAADAALYRAKRAGRDAVSV